MPWVLHLTCCVTVGVVSALSEANTANRPPPSCPTTPLPLLACQQQWQSWSRY